MNKNNNYDKKYAINNPNAIVKPIKNSTLGLKLVISSFTEGNKTTDFLALNSDQFEYDLTMKKSSKAFINLLYSLYSNNDAQLNEVIDIFKKLKIIDNDYLKSLSNKKVDKKVNKNTRLEVSYKSNDNWILFPEKFKNQKHFINWMRKNHKASFIDENNALDQNIENLENYILNGVFKIKEITIINSVDTTSFNPTVETNNNGVDTTSFNPKDTVINPTNFEYSNEEGFNPSNTGLTRDSWKEFKVKNPKLSKQVSNRAKQLVNSSSYDGRFPNKKWTSFPVIMPLFKQAYNEVLNIDTNPIVNNMVNGSGNTDNKVIETTVNNEVSGLSY